MTVIEPRSSDAEASSPLQTFFNWLRGRRPSAAVTYSARRIFSNTFVADAVPSAVDAMTQEKKVTAEKEAATRAAEDQQCIPCEPEQDALETEDVVSAIAAQISDTPTLKALSRTNKTAHDSTKLTLAARREQEAALSEGRFRKFVMRRGELNLRWGVSGKKTLSDEDIAALVELLTHNSALTCLELPNCNIDEAGGIAIAAALKDNKSLTYLDMRENNINVGGAKAFGAALEKNRTLTHLNLSNNALCGKEKWMVYSSTPRTKDYTGVKALLNAAKKASWPDGALRTLDLGDNFLGDYGERLLRDAMDKPAVIAERKREERELEEMFAAQRRRCAEGNCDTSCQWCDHGPAC